MSGNQKIQEKVSEKVEITPPKNYKVLLHNNNSTAHNIVIEILTNVFGLQSQKAYMVMITAERQGVAVVMTAPKDMAENKVKEANDYKDSLSNSHHGRPEDLLFTCEPVD